MNGKQVLQMGCNAVPKPTTTKRKRGHIMNPKPIEGSICLVCGISIDLETHEIFGGSSRNLSIQYGLQAILCHDHHQGTDGVHGKNGKPLAYQLHTAGQIRFEGRSGSRETFVRMFGRSYL